MCDMRVCVGLGMISHMKSVKEEERVNTTMKKQEGRVINKQWVTDIKGWRWGSSYKTGRACGVITFCRFASTILVKVK